MRTVFTTILTFILVSSQGQTIQTKSGSTDTIKEFKNQGEQEDSWTEQFFEKNYSRQKFEKYDSAIVTSGDTVKYSDKYFLVWTAEKFKHIFSKGIFYPTIITGPRKSDYRLTISNFEELKFLNHSPTQKRFRFWLNRNTLLNPTVCFIELTNQNATDKTDLETFISGALLTFYKEGWIII
jgi:hypothetical protein